MPVAAFTEAACAGEHGSAVLVVDTGGGEYEMCVELNDDAVTGIELIRLAEKQHGLDYALGYGGQAVCQLANVPEPNPPDECFEQGEPFWGYWRDQGSGWQWSGTGAGSTLVADGDVEGWAFGEGNNGESHPAPPPTDHADVCIAERRSGDSPQGSGGGGSEGPAPADESADAPTDRDGSPSEDRVGGDGERPRASTPAGDDNGRPGQRLDAAPDPSQSDDSLEPLLSPAPPLPATATSAADRREGFPIAGILAVAVTVAMGGAAAFMLIRSRPG